MPAVDRGTQPSESEHLNSMLEKALGTTDALSKRCFPLARPFSMNLTCKKPR